MAETAFKIITLQHRFAQDILPAVEPLVGSEGNISGIDNQLIVRTTPERMAQIEQVVATLDVERRNIRITVSHDDSSQTQRNGSGVTRRVRSGDVELGLPGGDQQGIQVNIDDQTDHFSQSGSEFVTVADGERAFIRVGQSVPYTQQWVLFTQRYAVVQQTTQFRDITTGFAVSPRYINGQVELEITPRISRLDGGGFVDFEALSTVVRVVPGQWFDLGGSMQSKDEVSRAILNQQQDASNRNTHLSIKVD